MTKKDMMAAIAAALGAYSAEGFTQPLFASGRARYAVSVTNNKDGVPPLSALASQALAFLDNEPEAFTARIHVGGWTDSETGAEYVDIGTTIDNLAEALALAKKYDQIAIFDLKEFKEIRV